MVDPFSELRKHAGGNHPHKAKLNIVLSAITDVIYERRGTSSADTKPISSTEYFAALMTALESADGSHQQEITQLLGMVLPYVSEAVLRAKYSAVAKCLVRVLHDASGEQALLRSAATCLGLVLLAQEPTASVWNRPDVLKAFHLLLSMATDVRPKLRKCAQKALIDVLDFHADNHCDALSTHIASFAENVFAASSSKDEARLVSLIGFLKTVLPFLQGKVVTSLVEALVKFIDSSSKTLRLVTLEAFEAVTVSPRSKASQETLNRILLSVLNMEMSTVHDNELAIHVVPILETALVRLYTVNEPQAKALLLRVVVQLCAHVEATNEQVQAQATQGLVMVLTQCLPREEVDQNLESTDAARVVSSLESLLTLRFQAAWKHVFEMFAELFQFYGESSYPMFNSIVRISCQLHEASEQMPGRKGNQQYHKYFEQVAGAAVAAIGPARFLEIVPIGSTEDVLNERRLWLLPVFKDALKSFACEVGFFSSTILGFAKECEAKSRADNTTPLMKKKYQMLTMQLWDLFPSFCVRAADIDTNFKKIAKTLANAMADQRYPELRIAVCQGLQALVKRTRNVQRRQLDDDADDEEDIDEDEEIDQEKLSRDRAALAKYSGRYLPLLITFVEEIDPEKDAEKAQILLDTIEGFASLAESSLVSTLFKTVMQKLLESTTQAKKLEGSASTSEAKQAQKPMLQQLRRVSHSQMALAMALLGHMDMESIDLLYRVIKPYLLDDTDPALQKRSYAVLVSICDRHPSFMSAETNLKDMTESICESLLTCSVPAKKMRLRCLVYLINALAAVEEVDVNSLIPNLVGEIILCSKEANGRAREASFDLLIAMAHLMQAKRPGTGLMEYLQMIMGGLAARTPHMRSASVVCLSRLVFEFGRTEAVVQQAMPDLLKTVLMLLHEKAREVIKSVIGFMKLGIAMLSPQQLEPFLPDIVNGLLVWIGESKNRFRAKTRIILIKLCRKYGYEKIADMVPPEDRALIRHIKKMKERDDKRKAATKSAQQDESFSAFMNDMEDSEDEDDAAEEDQIKKTLQRKKQMLYKKKLIKESGEDIVDFLDTEAAVRNIYSQEDQDMSDDDDDGVEFSTAKDGRLIIPDVQDASMKDGDNDSDEDEESMKQDVAHQLEKMGLSQGGSAKNGRKRRRADEDDGGNLGQEYRSKKASGDVKKKGKLEPYAYIPLDPKLMAKRNKRSAVNRYRSNVGKRKGKK